jgi:hypothetical protein
VLNNLIFCERSPGEYEREALHFLSDVETVGVGLARYNLCSYYYDVKSEDWEGDGG